MWNDVSQLWSKLTPTFKIYLIVILSGVVFGLFYLRRLSSPLKWVTALLSITFISEIMSRVWGLYYHTSYPVYHFYSPAECFLLLFILYSIANKPIQKRMIAITFSCLVIFSIINSIFIQTIYEFNSNIDLAKMPVAALTA